MAEEKKLQKWQDKANKALAKVREARGEAREANRMASKIPAPALILVDGVAMYATGLGDGAVGTPENQNPVTMAAFAVGTAGALLAAFTGHPTVAAAYATVGGSAFGVLAHAAGVKKAQESRRAA